MNLFRQLRRRGELFLAVALPALLLQSLIAPGYMAARDAAGGFTQLCSVFSTAPAAPDRDKSHEHQQLCAFAGAASAAPAPSIVSHQPPIAAVSSITATTSTNFHPRTIQRAQAARAPPV